MKAVRFLRPAEIEYLEAAAFYESRVPSLRIEFMSTVEDSVQNIRRNPKLFSVTHANIRRCLIRRFPYVVLYRDDPEEIVIVAIMHTSRRPFYWFDRLGE